MADNEVRNQHFVPRLYLRYFVNDKDRLFVYDKMNDRSFKTTVESVANEVYFYDFPVGDSSDAAPSGRNQIIDNTLTSIEGNFAETLRQLHSEILAGKITDSTKQSLVPFLAIQLMRTRGARDEVVELQEAMMQVIADLGSENESLSDQGVADIKVKFPKEYEPIIHAQSMFDPNLIGAISEAMNRHIWVVGHNATARPLYTSDHPIARHAHSSDPLISMSGIDSPGIEIAFPLSSSYILSMYHRESFKYAEAFENSVRELVEDNVIFCNDLQVSNSYRQIFCAQDNFDLAIEICRQRPHLRNPKRAKLQVNIGGRILGTRSEG